MPCPTVPQRGSTFLLSHLITTIIIVTSIHSICQGTPGRGTTTCDKSSQARIQMVSTTKKAAFLDRCTGRHVHRWELPHGLAGRTVKLQEREDYWLVFLSKAQSCRCLQLGLQSHERGQRTLLHHSPLGLGSQQHGWPLWHFQGTCPRCWLVGGVHSWNTTIMEWTRGIETCQLCSLIPTQRVKVPKGSVHQGIPQSHGPKGDPWLWCPLVLCQLYLLPMVWQGWTEWGDHHQPPENSTL